ncbi:MAG: hypothetical protein NWE95_08270 [Candidatus Bathyarchaeota archaeon]|nr:hypothetical protein [Candidatus Bathyarchaeota archaeon]
MNSQEGKLNRFLQNIKLKDESLENVSLKDVPLEDRRKEAEKPLFLTRYE